MISRDFRNKAAPYFSGEKEAFATTLVAAFVMLNGVESLQWDPATIQMEVKDDLKVDMPRKVYDKMMALITVMTTETVYDDIAIFDETVNALTGKGVGVDRDIPSVEEVAWAVTEIAMNDPEPVGRDLDKPYSAEIGKYVRVVLDNEGMRRAPDCLGFAPSKIVNKENHDDATMYAGAWGAAQATADEVDKWVEKVAVQLLQQLMDINVDFGKPTVPDKFEEGAVKPERVEQKVAASPAPAMPFGSMHSQLTMLTKSRCAETLD